MWVFPYSFANGEPHTIGELRVWEALLLEERKTDEGLSSDVRRARGAYRRAKAQRNKELAPLDLFAKHENLNDDVQFRMMPEGHHTDVEIVTNG